MQRSLNIESFGPVAPLCPVSSFEEAIRLANRSKYALGATIYTADLNEALRAVEEIEAGMVWINAPLFDNDAGPFGGRKQSGIGRQLGAEGLEPSTYEIHNDRSGRETTRLVVPLFPDAHLER